MTRALRATPIRVVTVGPSTLDEVVRAFPDRPRVLQEERLEDQRRGILTHLLARRGSVAAGHILLVDHVEREWDPWRDRFACAEIGDLYVAPEHRGHGVGRTLMRAAERLARARGYARVGLSTGTAEGYAAARALYGGLGYRPVSGWFIDSWRTPDEARGGWKPDGEILTAFFLKDLPPR